MTTALPTQRSPRIATLLAKMRSSTRAKIIFALDATASRQGVWDLACQLQSQMFEEAAKLGRLDIQLVWYRGTSNFRTRIGPPTRKS